MAPTHDEHQIDLGELAFSMEDVFVESSEATSYSSASAMLCRAQAEHTIFHDKFVTKAFYEAEKAHRGQVKIATPLTPDLTPPSVICV